MSSFVTCSILTLGLAGLQPLADGEGWLTDFEAAKKAAKQQGKDLLIDFTGSDWCVWCQRLKGEVFDEAAFKAEAPKSFVLVELDYPRKNKDMSEDLKAQNERLKTEYAIRGFPTIYLTDAEGKPYAKTGYKPGGPTPYLEHLASLRQVRTTRDTEFKAAAGAQGVEKAKHLAAGLSALPQEVLGFYKAEMDEVVKLDADNGAGLKAKFEAIAAEMALGKDLEALNQKVGQLARGKKWEEAGQAVDAFLAEHKVTGQNAQRLLGMRATIAEQGGDAKAAIDFLKKAIEADPKGPPVKAMKDRIGKLEKKLEGGN